MSFRDQQLAAGRPPRVRAVDLPRRQAYFPSPVDWRDELLYFLLVDRFSDGGEAARPRLDPAVRTQARPAPWRWDEWARSGRERWQGGTLAGVTSKLGYLRQLGVTALWLSPIFQQRGHLDTYHGYGIQDFLEVDPRFGTRRDLVQLVDAAHAQGIRVILDVVFNHSGDNWVYPPFTPGGADQPAYTTGRYPFGSWLDAAGAPVGAIGGGDDGVWPAELQDPERYTRAGAGDLGRGDIADPAAEHKRSDFLDLRDFRLEDGGLLADLARCFQYWIALTDCDGFRLDTVKHVSFEEARNFAGAIKEFAANLGKSSFFLVGEVAGGDATARRYLDALGRNLDAALDIGELRLALRAVAKGQRPGSDYFDGFDPGTAILGSHRQLGGHHVSVLDDHDHVFGEKLRFSTGAAPPHQVVAGVALQLFSLGIPCVYYGTEQGLAGPESSEQTWLPGWGGADVYLREAMFGPAHPRAAGLAGRQGAVDPALPGFGPFGTAGRHLFDPASPIYRRLAALAALRAAFPVLRQGRQYQRPTSFLGRPFARPEAGELVAWSRILADEEALVCVNPNGAEVRGADVVVDAALNPVGARLTVVASSEQAAANPAAFAGAHAVGSTLPVRRAGDGTAYVEVRDLPPAEVLVLSNRP